MAGFYKKAFGYFAALIILLIEIPVLALPITAARSVITTTVRFTVRITENRDAIGIGNGSLTSRTSGKPAAKAIGMIVGNQRVILRLADLMPWSLLPRTNTPPPPQSLVVLVVLLVM